MKIGTLRLWAALSCLAAMTMTASAQEPETQLPEEIAGICITRVPGASQGRLRLGQRTLGPGDVLTADQTRQICFEPGTEDRALLCYLPIGEDGVRESAVLSFGSRKNQAPIAQDSAAETYKNLENRGKLKVREPDGEPMTFTLVREPRRGTVTISPDGSFTYCPKKNKVGTDSFVYTAADPGGNVSREATVTVEILKPTDAPQYVDTAGRSCSFAAEWMKHTGLFTGETLDGSPCFQPDRPVTGGEFLTMLVRSMGLPGEPELTLPEEMAQVPVWLKPYLAAAIRSGLTAGLPDPEVFTGDREITEGEAAVMLQNALDLPVPAGAPELGPAAAPAWACPALGALADRGYGLRADRMLTRGQAAELLCGLRELLQKRP